VHGKRLIAVGALVVAGALAAGCGQSAPRRADPRPAPAITVATRPRPHPPDRGRVVVGHFYSEALRQPRTYLIYLPPGYAAAAAKGVRFPVLYLLHSAVGTPWTFLRGTHIDAVLRRELARHRVRPMLLVFVDGTQRGGTHDTEYANISIGRYEDAVLDTVDAVDRRWSTIRDRRARMLAGLSSGGYAAANVTLHHLGVFSGFESWSGYFVQTHETPFDVEPDRVLAVNSPLDYVLRLRPELERLRTWGFAYQGLGDPNADAAQMREFIRLFDEAGGHGTAAVYPGGHNIGLWARHLPAQLEWASRRLLPPQAPGVTPG